MNPMPSFADCGRLHRPAPAAAWFLAPASGVSKTLTRRCLETDHTSTPEHDAEPSPELLEAARDGDSEASYQLVRMLQPLVIRLVRNQVFRQADHEDVVQEAFLKVFVKLHQYRGPRPFTHWVSRLTVNTCYDWLRRQRARPLITASDLSEAEREILDQTLSQDHEIDNETRSEVLLGLLERLLAALKPREQIVIRMLDLEERPVAEISELTGWSASKIKVTAFRARRKLTDHLNRLERP